MLFSKKIFFVSELKYFSLALSLFPHEDFFQNQKNHEIAFETSKIIFNLLESLIFELYAQFHAIIDFLMTSLLGWGYLPTGG